MVPAIAALASRGLASAAGMMVQGAKVFEKSTDLYAKQTEKTERFISSIAQYSGNIQAGQAQAEAIKVKADLASDKIGGKEFKQYLVQGAKTDAEAQKVATYFYKWGAEVLTVLNKLLQIILESIIPILEAIDAWMKNFWEAIVSLVKDFADTLRTILGEVLTASLIEWANKEEARIAREKTLKKNPAIQNIFSEYLDIKKNSPIVPGVL